MVDLETSIKKLDEYVKNHNFKGFDPYDTLNSVLPIKLLGTYLSAIAIQIQKRNPLNIRPLLGIKKGINPKAMGLFLKAYSLLYQHTGQESYRETADYIFNWLANNYSKGYTGHCWGYNFDWASPGNYHKKYTPSVVVTAFVIDGVMTYFNTTRSSKASQLILSAANYIYHDLPRIVLEDGLCITYTEKSTGCCYNASLLGAETLAKSNAILENEKYKSVINQVVSYVLSKQKENGSWYYSYDPENKTERKQIDFHQGFILMSLKNIIQCLGLHDNEIEKSIKRGLNFYYHYQFKKSGQAYWRLPKEYPVDIHNQAQGIITFTELSDFDDSYLPFARKILNWTFENMYNHKKGYFYYRKYPFFTNKISFIRWGQAWMLLALVSYKIKLDKTRE